MEGSCDSACAQLVNADRLSVAGGMRHGFDIEIFRPTQNLLFLPVTAEAESGVLSNKKTGSSNVE